MSINDGGPAFPRDIGLGLERDGMSLRDYFAAKAMQAYCVERIGGRLQENEVIARFSYQIADAMLLEREKSKVNVA